MYNDPFYDLIEISGVSWIVIAVFYAFFDYIFNLVMCWITGGFQKTILLPRKRSNKRAKFRTRINNRIAFLKLSFSTFQAGGYERVKEFQSDSASWYWPITVLAIPIVLYGVSHSMIINTTVSLNASGIPITDYRLFIFKSFTSETQYFIWFAASLNSFITFYRYRRSRSVQTWFSKSFIFHFLRIILFDALLGYLIINIILASIDFTTALYGLLLDDSVTYMVFHPDLMYGLNSAYKALVGINFFLILVSLLPTVMLIRESHETYRWVYYSLVYSGIVIIFIFTSVLAYQFHLRLGAIQEGFLTDILRQINLDPQLMTSTDPMKLMVGLQYYELVTGLPNSFPIPPWLQYIIGFRTILVFYEVFALFSKRSERPTINEFVRRFLQTAS